MKKWSFQFRVWHWVHATIVLGLIGTVFLRKTFLSWRENSHIILQQLHTWNIDITQEQAKLLAKAIRAPMWEWHILLGYGLAVVLVWRIALFFTASGRRSYQEIKQLSLHKKVVKLSYLLLYALLLFMSISGLVLTFGEDFSLSTEKLHAIKEVHEALFAPILLFVIAHIAGVVMAENKNERGILSDMIHGGEASK